MMNGKMSGAIDPKKKVLDELMSYLDEKDTSELGMLVKPKEVEMKVEGMEEPHTEPDGDEGLEIEMKGEATPEMSQEEMDELIEAIQSKLGA